ncbi:MAG TPA: PQQ-binding-like beta-propeller repeat protein [Pirellulales bacterium]|nr:PQQ-binding-like beta-propeller repeat protein [Pirellulales bacterium]
MLRRHRASLPLSVPPASERYSFSDGFSPAAQSGYNSAMLNRRQFRLRTLFWLTAAAAVGSAVGPATFRWLAAEPELLIVEAGGRDRGYAADDWPRWRGPEGNAVSSENDLPIEWSATRNVAWKAEILGEGSSSPIVSGDSVIVTSSLEHGFRRLTHCFDRASGEKRWTREIEDDDPEVASSMTGHAAATPAADGRRVVCAFGRAGLVCYDYEGRQLWRVALGQFESELGLASSPIIDGDRVFMVCDHDGDRFTSFDSYLLAVKLTDGNTHWKAERRGLYRSWSTPIVANSAGQKMLIVSAQDELRAYDPLSGKQLWQLPCTTGWVTPSPVYAAGTIFAVSGKNGPVVAIRPAAGDDAAAEIAWKLDAAGPYVCSPIVYGDYLYVHGEAGVLTCYHAADGRQIYRQRLPGKFTASAVAGAGKLYFTNEEGTTYVVTAGAEFKLLAANPLNEYMLASPAISGRRLFLRTEQHLYCIAPGTERSR